MKRPTVAVINHGCKLNQFEGESIAHSLSCAGFEIVDTMQGENNTTPRQNRTGSPDVIIVNTCTVTGKSDRKSRHSILHAARALAGRGMLIVTGCYAETNPDDLRKIEGVDLVVGQKEKASIPEIIRREFGYSAALQVGETPEFEFHDPSPNRSRAFVKVQDGCDMHCSYCKVPAARGHSRSRRYTDVIAACSELIANGYHEVVLTGVNLGSYRFETVRLAGLISLILKEVSGDFRIRLSSIEPVYFTDELIELISQNVSIAPHFHIPLQSGSNRILRLMKRPYTPDSFLETVRKLRGVRPESHIALDVIVGFPTETEEDFRQTERVIRETQCGSLHVFRYSVRDKTPAAHLHDNVSYRDKSLRSERLIRLGSTLGYMFRKRFLWTVRDAIVQRNKNGSSAVTDNYITVRLPGEEQQKKRCRVRILDVTRDQTVGEIV